MAARSQIAAASAASAPPRSSAIWAPGPKPRSRIWRGRKGWGSGVRRPDRARFAEMRVPVCRGQQDFHQIIREYPKVESLIVSLDGGLSHQQSFATLRRGTEQKDFDWFVDLEIDTRFPQSA